LITRTSYAVRKNKYWQDLLERLISIIQFLLSDNLAFRGHRETLSLDSPQNSGNLIDSVKLLSKYDPVLREHFHHIHGNEIQDHYLSHEIQSEIIELMYSKMKETIVNKIKLLSILPYCWIALETLVMLSR
jgi:hypothetical protein